MNSFVMRDVSPRVAVVHEWLVNIAGSEKVLANILQLFPSADVFFVCYDVKLVQKSDFLMGRKISASFIQKLPQSSKRYKSYLPLMPLAIEQLDLSKYDIVISSSHAVAKGVLTGPDQLHISYIHSPIRYAWDLQHQYLRESGLNSGIKSFLARLILHRIRLWDYRTAAGVDFFVANSKFIARRVKKVYGRTADVIWPPVDVADFEFSQQKEDFFVTASRLVPYKRVDLVVDAFGKLPDKKLVVIGDGPDMEKIRRKAGSNVTILGYQSFEQLKNWMSRAKAFVFAAEEDFGITPVEAQACGTPVIALGKGGSLETVNGRVGPGRTGVWFAEQTVESLIGALREFESLDSAISANDCRMWAEKFSADRFKSEFKAYVADCWANFSRD